LEWSAHGGGTSSIYAGQESLEENSICRVHSKSGHPAINPGDSWGNRVNNVNNRPLLNSGPLHEPAHNLGGFDSIYLINELFT